MSPDPFSRMFVRRLKNSKFFESQIGPAINYSYLVPPEEEDFNHHRGSEYYPADIKRAAGKLLKDRYDLMIDKDHRFPGIKSFHIETFFKNWGQVFVRDELVIRTGLLLPVSGLTLTQLVRSTNNTGDVVFTSVSNYCLLNTNMEGTPFESVGPYFIPQV